MKNKTKKMKVEIKSLATKSRSIQKEIRKTDDLRLQMELQFDRFEVRQNLRHLHLAYGFLRGLSYEQVERDSKSRPSFSTIEKHVKKYGACRDWSLYSSGVTSFGGMKDDGKERREEQATAFEAWKEEAKAYLDEAKVPDYWYH